MVNQGIFLAPHGQAEWNLECRQQWRLNSSLTEVRRRQAHGRRGRRIGITGTSRVAKAMPSLRRVLSLRSKRPVIVAHEVIHRVLLILLLGPDVPVVRRLTRPHDAVNQIHDDTVEKFFLHHAQS